MSGKGSAPRPFSVDNDTFSSNWEQIFGAKSKDSTENENGTANTGKLDEKGSGATQGLEE